MITTGHVLNLTAKTRRESFGFGAESSTCTQFGTEKK
jgi:hypothetical protein